MKCALSAVIRSAIYFARTTRLIMGRVAGEQVYSSGEDTYASFGGVFPGDKLLCVVRS